ncbi:hypothetical protein BC829DRAFT_33600 [Chytridium lagenaria]|nr:hypothetical protein BC829DRAFT_33600 [Chytridium lagenaria]
MRYASVLIAGGFLTWALITLVMASIQFSKYILWIDGVEIGLHVIWVAADLFGIHATFRKEPRRTWLYAHWITLRIIVAFALRCVGFQHSRLPFTLAAAIIVLLIQVYFVLCLWSFALTILPSDDMYAYPKRANSQKRACSQNGTPRPAPSVILRPDVSTDTQSIRSGSIMNPSNFTSAIQSPDSPTLSHSSIPISYPITHSIPSPPIMDGPVSGVLDSAHTTMSPNEIEDMTSSQVFFASLPRKRALADQDNMSSSSLPTSFLTSEGSDQPAVYTIKTHTRSSSNPPYPLDHKASFATLQHNKVPASYPPPQDIGPAVPKVFLE